MRVVKYKIASFTARELKIIELRTHGVKTPDIAKRLGIPRNTAYNDLWRIYGKVGVDDVALLTRWAMANGMDEALEPQRAEDLPKPEKKRHKGKIKLNRLGRAGIRVRNWPHNRNSELA